MSLCLGAVRGGGLGPPPLLFVVHVAVGAYLPLRCSWRLRTRMAGDLVSSGMLMMMAIVKRLQTFARAQRVVLLMVYQKKLSEAMPGMRIVQWMMSCWWRIVVSSGPVKDRARHHESWIFIVCVPP